MIGMLLAESGIERLPCIGEFLKVGCSLRQGFGSAMQEVNGITVAQSLYSTFVAQLG